VGTHSVARLVDTFARGENAEPVAFIGSSGYVEIAVNKGNASRALGIGRGAPVVLGK
jgi:S-adenosyl-L-methionine hydrolase (adenosine-forming)